VQLQMARDAGHPADVAAAALADNSAKFLKGPIKVSDIYNLYPYENTLWVIQITGAVLKAAIEYNARYWASYDPTNAPSAGPGLAPFMKHYGWDMYSGIDYDIDLGQPVGQRVARLQFKGQEVKPDQILTLAINNFRATGGGGFRMFKDAKVLWRGETEIREALADYIAARRTISPRDCFVQNWRLLTPTNAAAENL